MVFLVLYNTEYDRQWEVTISEDIWKRLERRYGAYEGIMMAVKYYYDPMYKGLATKTRNRAFRKFIDVISETPEDNMISITPSKRTRLREAMSGKDLVVVGRGEYEVRKK